MLRKRERRFIKPAALRDENLGAYNVDAGDHFGNGMFHLDAGVDFDEEEFVGVNIDQEFDGASVAVACRLRQLQSRLR